MKKVTTPPGVGQNDVLRTLAEALAPYLKASAKQDAPEYYSQHDSPLGRRRHLALARSGAFQGHRVGKLVLVRRDAVHEFIEQHPSDAGCGGSDDVLRDWGLTSGRQP